MNEWLTINEAKAYLKIKSKTTLYNLVKQYGIRQSRVLSLTYFSREDIDRMMNENAVVWQPDLSK